MLPLVGPGLRVAAFGVWTVLRIGHGLVISLVAVAFSEPQFVHLSNAEFGLSYLLDIF